MAIEIPTSKVLTPAAKFASSKVFSHFKAKRQKAIWTALERCDYTPESPELQKDEFISCYLATEQALFKSTSQAKLNALIAMFINGVDSKKIFDQSDKYQEILSIISDLSERELIMLFWLFKFEESYEKPKQIKDRAVKQQLDYLEEKTNLKRDLLKALLIRLKRTGLLISSNDMSDSVDMMIKGHDLLYLSELAHEVKEWIMFTIDLHNSNPLHIDRDAL